jgi:hypothetical protein
MQLMFACECPQSDEGNDERPPAENPTSLTLSIFNNAWQSVPWKHRVLTVLASLGINLALPFINGVMLGAIDSSCS